MSDLSDYTDAVAALVSGAATFKALSDTVKSTAVIAKVKIGDDVAGLVLRAEQADLQATELTAKGNAASTARPHYYLSDTFPNNGT